MKIFVGCFQPKDPEKKPYTALCFDLGYTVKRLYGISEQDQAEILGVSVRDLKSMNVGEKIEVK